MRWGCTSRPIKAIARPPRTPWEETPARSPNLKKCGDEKSYGKDQGSAEERDEALSLAIGCSTRHCFDPFARVKTSLLLKIHGSSDRELAHKTAD